MGVIKLEGALSAYPSGDGAFPAAIYSTVLSLVTVPKTFGPSASAMSRSIDSPSAYVELSGIGADGDVEEATTFYLRSDSNMSVRLTYLDASSAVLPVFGTLLQETTVANPIVLAEVQGVGTIEYFASGPVVE